MKGVQIIDVWLDLEFSSFPILGHHTYFNMFMWIEEGLCHGSRCSSAESWLIVGFEIDEILIRLFFIFFKPFISYEQLKNREESFLEFS